MQERRSVFGQTGATPAGSGLQEGRPDPRVGAHACGDVADVGTEPVTQLGQGIGVGKLHRQEGVAGVFGQLCALRAHPQHGRRIGAVGGAHPRRVGVGISAHHDAVGVGEVGDRAALPEELRAGGDTDAQRGHPVGDRSRRADRHRRFQRDHGAPGQHLGQLRHRGVEGAQVGGAVVAARSGHANENHVAVRQFAVVGAEPQPSRRQRPRQQVGQSRLVDDRHTGTQARHPDLVDVDRHDVEAASGQADRRGQADVSDAHHADARGGAHAHLARTS